MHIAVVDDILEDRESISQMLESFFQKYNIEFSISTFASAEEFLNVFEPEGTDLCFMDIYMDGIDGMEAAKKIRAIDSECQIIFLTSSDQYVYEGYEVQALRYLMKPLTPDMLSKLIPVCIEKAELNQRRLSVTIGKTIKEIPYGKILYVNTEGINVKLHFFGSELKLSSHRTFSETVSPLLKDFRFITCGRGVVVNLSHVKELDKDCFIMDNHERVPVSRRQLAAASAAFVDYQFDHL